MHAISWPMQVPYQHFQDCRNRLLFAFHQTSVKVCSKLLKLMLSEINYRTIEQHTRGNYQNYVALNNYRNQCAYVVEI